MSEQNKEEQQSRGAKRDLRGSAEPSRAHPITGKAYAAKVTEAFDPKKVKDPVSAFKSFQAIMIEHARLMSWLYV